NASYFSSVHLLQIEFAHLIRCALKELSSNSLYCNLIAFLILPNPDSFAGSATDSDVVSMRQSANLQTEQVDLLRQIRCIVDSNRFCHGPKGNSIGCTQLTDTTPCS